MTKELTQAQLKQLLHYDPETGVFTWIVRSCNRWPEVGRVAGTVGVEGYRVIIISGIFYKAHHLAWLYVNGVWPVDQVDHENGRRDGNWIKNLRPCTHGENHQNRKDPERRFPGPRGAYYVAGRWRATIVLNRVNKHLGYFDTPEEAHQAYLTAKAQLHTFQPTPRTT